jgi:predicted RNA-binding Zn ribbon-like protein
MAYSRVMPSSSMPVEGLPDWELAFRFTAGRLCLAFCATVGERWQRNFERLRSAADYGRWVVEAGLLPSPPDVGQADLEAARELREAIYRGVRAAMDGHSAASADLKAVNAWAARPGFAPQLDFDWTKRTEVPVDPVAATLSTVARDAVDLLGGPERHRIRECAAPDCALLFVDRSRPGTRRWCADNACGNRSRVADYRRRHARVRESPAASRRNRRPVGSGEAESSGGTGNGEGFDA